MRALALLIGSAKYPKPMIFIMRRMTHMIMPLRFVS
jgi:hypothetical protein